MYSFLTKGTLKFDYLFMYSTRVYNQRYVQACLLQKLFLR